MKNLIKKYPNISYFTIAFGWAWLLVFLLIVTKAVEDINNPTIFFVLAGLACNISPSISAYIVTRVSKGKDGVREIKDRFRAKNKSSLMAFTIITVPVVWAVTTAISNFAIREYEFAMTIPVIFMGMIWPLFSSFGEEFGWRGFVLPKLLSKQSPLKAGIILGLIWSLWHVPMDYIAYKDYGVYLIPAFLVMDFINLMLQSVIMTHIFVKSKGSIKLMVLYHYTITATAIIPGAFLKAEPLPQYTVYEGIVSVSIFLIIAIILYAREAVIARRSSGLSA